MPQASNFKANDARDEYMPA